MAQKKSTHVLICLVISLRICKLYIAANYSIRVFIAYIFKYFYLLFQYKIRNTVMPHWTWHVHNNTKFDPIP